MPCVFAPYVSGNIHRLYNNGETLNDLLNVPFLQAIRNWQVEYGFGKDDLSEKGNLLMPCPYRDHNKKFMRWVKKYNLEVEEGTDQGNISVEEHSKKFSAYHKKLAELLDPVWKEKYLDR
jgi:hypothetical protein